MPTFRLADLAACARRLVRSLPAPLILLTGVALSGCAAPERSAPPAGDVITSTQPQVIGPHVTKPAVVRVDGFNGPEYREVWYRYTAMLEKGSARVTDDGALELLDGTLFVHSRREWRSISADSALERAVWARADDASRAEPGSPNPHGDPHGDLHGDLRDLLALQIVAQPSSVTEQYRALWWYPIVVSDPTQQGTVGTNFVVQRSVDASGNATSRVFLRPPVLRPFAPPSRVWLASAAAPAPSNADDAKGAWAEKDQGVAWLLGTDVYAESVRGPQGVETRILPVDDALAQELKALDERARKAGVR